VRRVASGALHGTQPGAPRPLHACRARRARPVPGPAAPAPKTPRPVRHRRRPPAAGRRPLFQRVARTRPAVYTNFIDPLPPPPRPSAPPAPGGARPDAPSCTAPGPAANRRGPAAPRPPGGAPGIPSPSRRLYLPTPFPPWPGPGQRAPGRGLRRHRVLATRRARGLGRRDRGTAPAAPPRIFWPALAGRPPPPHPGASSRLAPRAARLRPAAARPPCALCCGPCPGSLCCGGPRLSVVPVTPHVPAPKRERPIPPAPLPAFPPPARAPARPRPPAGPAPAPDWPGAAAAAARTPSAARVRGGALVAGPADAVGAAGALGAGPPIPATLAARGRPPVRPAPIRVSAYDGRREAPAPAQGSAAGRWSRAGCARGRSSRGRRAPGVTAAQ
jgi:hypothetical protein